jgi:phage terminase Nu1 subunit (DNA packaging protein)
MGLIVNQQKLAEYLDKSIAIIRKWQENGMPVLEVSQGKGQHKKFDLAQVFDWYEKYLHGKNYDYKKERVRLTGLQADEQEIKLRLLKKEIIKVDEVQKEISKLLTSLRSKLLSVAPKVSGDIIGESEQKKIKAIIENGIREAIDEFINAYK